METLKMHKTFVHILEENTIKHSTERKIEGACSLLFFQLTHPGDTHPDYWEIHPDGDELLLVTRGELDVEMVTQPYNGEDMVPENALREMATVSSGELLIVKKGHWHRLLLKKETDLIVTAFKGNSKLAPVKNVLSKSALDA